MRIFKTKYCLGIVGIAPLLAILPSTSLAAYDQVAAEVLSQHGIQPTANGALSYLRKLTPDESVRARIVELVNDLGSDSFSIRERASRELTALGDIAEPQLKAAVKSGDLEQKTRARRLLMSIESNKSGDLKYRLLMAAMHVLKHDQSKEATEILLGVLPLLEDQPLRDAASEALWANVRPSNESAIRAKLSDPNLSTRAAAVVALELSIGEQSVKDLRDLLNSKNALIRLAAARALMNHLPSDCLQTLIGLLGCNDLEVQMQASFLLKCLTGHQVDDANLSVDKVNSHWRKWAEANVDTTALHVPIGKERLQLSHALLVFREGFVKNVASITDRYGRFRYESTLPAKASIADGTLRLHGNHPEADQRLFVTAKDLIGRTEFPDHLVIQSKLTGEADGAGVYHVGVSIGRIKVLFHPAYSGGAFRVETVNEHKTLISNESMGFTPAAGVMHEMRLALKSKLDGLMHFEVEILDGNDPRQRFKKRFEIAADEVRPLTQIGLDRSGRTGGAGLFGSVVIDLSGK